MDVRDQRNAHLGLDGVDRAGAFFVGHRQAHDLGAGRLHRADLRDGGLDVPGLGIAHGLHADRDTAAHGKSADHDLFCLFFLCHPVTSLKISWNIT